MSTETEPVGHCTVPGVPSKNTAGSEDGTDEGSEDGTDEASEDCLQTGLYRELAPFVESRLKFR